ncbi:16 kDa calcium-binding protein, variant 2 [Clonorchis sinensis]|uniref:16 kDa calcium-binding protein n=2 Tax=Clonorchis sinensis TaxID=79923 RepID=H2KRT0_CLOSI|nr:16 kDa calcium-binding protein, variant 2 [Clonorchis sinensis]GAA40982.1 16 kDa calcium-binding protein [Clonorchis sinensis]
MCHGISAQQLEELFQSLDHDGSGAVDREELTVALKEAGIPEKNAERIIQELDVNQDGHITLGEYRLVMGLTDEPIAEWKRLFVTLDSDRSGKVDKRELQQMFDEMGMHFALSTLEDWIADHDVDGDGKLTYQEFMGFVAEQIAQ